MENNEQQRHDDENELYNLGMDIKKLFQERVRQISKQSSYKVPKVYDDYEKTWKRAAVLCQMFKVSPEYLVDTAIQTYLGSAKYRSVITPHILYDVRTKNAIKQLVSNDMFTRVSDTDVGFLIEEAYSQAIKEYVNGRFEFLNMLQQCQNKIDKNRVLQIVRMEAFDLPCWLRVVVTNGEDPIVNSRFGQQAAFELMSGIRGLKEELESRGRGTNVDNIIRKLRYKQ